MTRPIPSIPEETQILVIGGGPAGSYTASLLAREGFRVTLLEAAKFPRYHIGESMLPSLQPFLRLVECDEKVINHGFRPKPGAAVKLNQFKREGYTDFSALGSKSVTWNVIRSEFDDILLKHASSCGVEVHEETRVTSITFDDSGNRPVAAQYKKVSGGTGEIHFDYLVDASGRQGIMSTKYLRNRRTNMSLHNVAHWAYWKDGGVYMPNTTRHNAPFFEALTDETGWAWYIPLHNGTVSVGVVMGMDAASARKTTSREECTASGESFTNTKFYNNQLKFHAPHIFDLLVDATMVAGSEESVKSASDFSYTASSHAGDHFRLVGDAGAFIDPFFSSGVHLALAGGLSAAASISSSIRGEVEESKAAAYHTSKVSISYTRFSLVVMSAYRQMCAQELPVLSDVDEDNFDRAFDIIRPVIQGSADTGTRLTEDELQQTMDFCKHILAPTDPEVTAAVEARLDTKAMPLMSPVEVDRLIAENDEDARDVVKKMNARKIIAGEYSGVDNMEIEAVDGYTIRCKRGLLGLRSVAEQQPKTTRNPN